MPTKNTKETNLDQPIRHDTEELELTSGSGRRKANTRRAPSRIDRCRFSRSRGRFRPESGINRRTIAMPFSSAVSFER